MSFSFSLIVAMDAHRGIGKDGDLPWRLSADLKYFKKVTTKTDDSDKQNAVVMGRKTWDSLPEKFKPLPGRVNIVLTHNKNFFADGVLVIHDFKDIEKTCRKAGNIEKIFIIGGEQIFRLALQSPHCERIYLTAIDKSFDCDTFFPDFEKDFTLTESTPAQKEEGKTFSFHVFTKKPTS